MKSYHNKQGTKDFYLQRVRAHREADEIIHGKYWEDGRGCAVGCTIHSGEHSRYETELGIPTVLARLEDGIFEGLSNGESRAWPEAFLDAVPVGADLSMVWPRFAHWLLVDPEHGVIRFAKRGKSAVEAVAALYQRWIDGDKPKHEEWVGARSAAAAAYADAASDAASDASDAAAYADAASDAAYAASDAAYAAAYADAASDAAYARRKARSAQAAKLIALLREAK